MQMEATGRVIEELTSLLRRELASVSLYEEALEELHATGTPLADSLRAMGREHARNSRTLRAEVARLGGMPIGGAGVFSALAGAAEGEHASEAILRALLSCEERALRSYEDAARRLPGVFGALVREVLVPSRRRHLRALRGLLPLPGHGDCTSPQPAEGTRTSPEIKEVAI